MTHFSVRRPLAILFLLFFGSLASGQTVTLVPQEQTIANLMVTSTGQGRPTMILDPIIEGVARARAKDMAVRNYFAHVNPDGVAADYLLMEAGYQLPAWWDTAANPTDNYVESIAAGSPSATATWAAWMASPDHVTHLLAQNSFYATETHYGVGYYYDPNSTYQYYWVVITAPPQPITITTPVPASTVTTPTVPVAGTADPTTGAVSVQFRVENLSGTSAYQTATGLSTWSGTAALVSGSNLIRAQSLDGSGNVLGETTTSFIANILGNLTVTVSGSGSVTAGFAGVTTGPVGAPVTIKATPAAGSIFLGWTGSIVSGSASLSFPMQNSMALQANFEPKTFPALNGNYYGILTTGSGAPAGLLRMTVSTGGLFTGSILAGGTSSSFTGGLNPNGSATVTIPNPAGGSWTVTLQADLSGASGQITGTLASATGSFGFAVTHATYTATNNPAPQAGKYTLLFGPDPTLSGTAAPQGCGYASIVIGTVGGATLVGRLADGTQFSAAGFIANNGTLALYFIPTGGPAGSSVTGVVNFRSTSVSDIDGTLAWTKAPNPLDPCYPAGYTAEMPCVGSFYTVPATGSDAMNVAPGLATAGLSGGNLPQPIGIPVTVNQAETGAMVTPGAPNLTFSINPSCGAIAGTLVLPNGGGTHTLFGVVLQKQFAAYGFFRGITQCGSFAVVPGN